MRICIVGCGAVGSLFAANLATLDDLEVWAFDLSQPHVDAIGEHGLRLCGAGEVHARLHATSDAAEPWIRPLLPTWIDFAVSSSTCTRCKRTSPSRPPVASGMSYWLIW